MEVCFFFIYWIDLTVWLNIFTLTEREISLFRSISDQCWLFVAHDEFDTPVRVQVKVYLG